MAMERFLTSLVFCEAPLDAAFYGATSTSVTTGVKKMISGAGSTGATKPEAADHKAEAGKKRWAQRQAGYELAFDGLNCFETVVMH